MGRFQIRHETVYRYRSAVAFGDHRLMLRPRESLDQRTLAYDLAVDPEPATLAWSEDASGNRVGWATFARRSRTLTVVATMEVEHTPFREADLRIAEHGRTSPFSYGAEEMPDLARFLERQHPDRDHEVDRWARAILAEDPGRDTWAFLLRMTAAIRHDLAYMRREEPGIQPPSVTLRTGRGSCRDFAVLMCEAVRSQGFAARFVSGYLHSRSGEERSRQAGGFTHAWLQVYLPGGGWIDFDPTSGSAGNAELIRVAVVRDPAQASPLSGSFMGFPADYVGMSVNVDVVARRDPVVGATAVAA